MTGTPAGQPYAVRMATTEARYVALGSSFAAGPGIPPVVDRTAMRSGRNYAHLVAARLGLRLTDVTSSGAATGHLLVEPQVTELGTLPPQLDAVTPGTELVTMTVGGNDIDYIGAVIQTWFGSQARAAGRYDQWRAQHAGPLARDPRESLAAVPDARAAIEAVIQSVRRRAPRAVVVVVDYLTVLGPDVAEYPAMPISPDDLAALRALGDALERATAAAAAAEGALLVSASRASRRHGVGAVQPWVTGPLPPEPAATDPLLREPAAEPTPFHPNAEGMAAVADLVTTVLRSR